MNQSKIIVLLIILTLTGYGNASAQMFRADKKFENYQYSEAIPLYREIVEKDSTKITAWIKLADCYRLINNTEEAEKCYSRVVNSDNAPHISKLYYAQMLLSNEKYIMARQWFTEYSIDEPLDIRGREFVNAIQTRDRLNTDSSRFVITKLNINTPESDFGAVPYKDGIVFSSSRENTNANTKKDLWTGSRYISIYYAKGKGDQFSEPEIFNSQIQVKFNNGPICFNSNGSEMYFTRNNPETNLSVDDYNVDKLKIFSIVLEGGKSGSLKPFEYNNSSYSCAHPVLSKDGMKLYFSSDMPGTIGGMDLWVCRKFTEGWGTPENLGPAINTKGNEIFPTIDDNDNIYFSSNGLPGLGGLDLFITKYKHGEYVEPHNLGAPFNSSDDDFSLYLNPKTRSGYFSSNRYHQDYNDDIFAFKSNEIILDGNVFDKLTSLPISMADIKIIDEGSNAEAMITSENGKFTTYLVPHKTYRIFAKNKNYKSDSLIFQMDTMTTINDSLTLKIALDNIFAKNTVFVLDNILYDLDKYQIRTDAALELDKVVTIMKENPKLKLELSSHTDCRATDKYNLKLSEKRAEAAVEYLILQGIDKDRLVSKGYGESKPLHPCECENNGSSACSDEEHQLNRRTEIKVLENQ